MRKETKGKRHVEWFDSFGDYVAYQEGIEDRSTDRMGDKSFYGVRSMSEAIDLAHAGLPHEGIEALAIAESEVQQMDKELISQQFQWEHAIEGAEVDVARYLSGEPDNMINYFLANTQSTQRVVTLVLALGVSCNVSARAITKHGQRLVALVEAIERTGLQVEIWGDMSQRSEHPTRREPGYTSRQAVRLKAPGELFDAGMFMYALTHASMLRALGFNTMRHYPDKWVKALGSHLGYPELSKTLVSPDEYPAGAIYIPPMERDSDAGKCVEETLRTLGLLA